MALYTNYSIFVYDRYFFVCILQQNQVNIFAGSDKNMDNVLRGGKGSPEGY
jgi:hypothetical protein